MAKKRTRGSTPGPARQRVRASGRVSPGGGSPRILRPRDPFTKTSLQPGRADRFGQRIAVSKNVFTQGGKRLAGGARKSVRRLHVRDPYNINSTTGIAATGATAATFAPEADQFTNNPNPSFHPEAQPSSVEVVQVPLAPTSEPRADRSHGKVFKPNRQTLLGGKTIRKR